VVGIAPLLAEFSVVSGMLSSSLHGIGWTSATGTPTQR